MKTATSNKKAIPVSLKKQSKAPTTSTDEKERSKPKAENSSVPLTSILEDRPTMNRATSLLKKAAVLKKAKEVAEAELSDIRDELAAIVMTRDLKGLRYGQVAFHCNGYVSRSTFNKDKAKALMLEYNVPPEEIGGCYEQGKEFLDAKITELS